MSLSGEAQHIANAIRYIGRQPLVFEHLGGFGAARGARHEHGLNQGPTGGRQLHSISEVTLRRRLFAIQHLKEANAHCVDVNRLGMKKANSTKLTVNKQA